MKKAVQFGAGNIGRGFIGELLHNSGYEITFVEVNPTIVEQVNRKKSYDLCFINEGYKRKVINHVKAISPITDEELVIQAIAEGDILTTSVWADNLSKVAPVIAKGLKKRAEINNQKINILACENALFASDTLKKCILNSNVGFTEESLDQIACFPNTAVDRMVFDAVKDGEKVVEVGSSFELVIEKNKLADSIEEPIKGADYPDNLQKFLERKLYIANCSHAIAGYLGYVKGYEFVQDALADQIIHQDVVAAASESAKALSIQYDFTYGDLQAYIKSVIEQWMTPGVKDPIIRVSRSPIRKLNPTDRLVGPALACEKLGVERKFLSKGIAAVFCFKNTEDPQAVELQNYIDTNGIEQAISYYTKIEQEEELYSLILDNYKELIGLKQTN